MSFVDGQHFEGCFAASSHDWWLHARDLETVSSLRVEGWVAHHMSRRPGWEEICDTSFLEFLKDNQLSEWFSWKLYHLYGPFGRLGIFELCIAMGGVFVIVDSVID